jgi:hypothetical protein
MMLCMLSWWRTLGPEKTVFDDDANEATKDTVARKRKRLDADSA